MPVRYIALCLMLASFLSGGCGDVAGDDIVGTPCDRAQARLSECLDLGPTESPGECNENIAAEVATMDCAAIRLSVLDLKADGIASFACRHGVYSVCPVPACEEPLIAPTDNDDCPESECVPADCAKSALEAQGCALCGYYDCLETQYDCGEDGYVQAFARSYCLRFQQVVVPRASPAATAWLDRVARCLISELDARGPFETCDELEAVGLESHAPCYVNTGFCDLAPSDWWLVLSSINPRDLGLREVLTTSIDCISLWLKNTSR